MSLSSPQVKPRHQPTHEHRRDEHLQKERDIGEEKKEVTLLELPYDIQDHQHPGPEDEVEQQEKSFEDENPALEPVAG